jgi:anti-anti-sigma factor
MKIEERVESRFNDKIQIITLNGRLTYDLIGEYKSAIQGIIKDAEGYIINLNGVSQIDSTGMGLLVNTAKYFISNKNKMIIVNEDELIKELFMIAKLDQVFEIKETISDALTAVNVPDEEYWMKVKIY